MMPHRVNLAEAKARLSALVRRAAAGDPVEITSRGKPLAGWSRRGHPAARSTWRSCRR